MCANDVVRSMKVAISIPDELFETAETLGKKLGISRSRLYSLGARRLPGQKPRT